MRITKLLSTCGAVAAAAALSVTTARAQTSASSNVTATATVAGALTAATVQGLGFGTVIPNFNRTVLPTDPTAGIVEFSGALGSEVNVSFTSLPANLSDGASHTLPIGSYSAGFAATQAGSQTGFTPASGATTRLDAGSGNLYVFVGGTVSPAAAQVAGTYTGTITIQAAYTGN